MTTRVLVVGLGGIGCGYDRASDPQQQVRSHARAFAMHPRFELVGGVDPEPARRDEFTVASGATAFAGLEAALAQTTPELVVIATPTHGHREVLERVLAAAQPKLVLCEKPLAPDPGMARAMVEACEQRGVELYVNYFRRSLPGALEVRRRLESGRIASGGKAVAWYSKGFLHNGSHFFNLLEYWLGPLQEARALGPARGGPAGPEVDCHARFERGEAVLLAAWEEAYSHFPLELVTRTGRLRFEGDGAMLWQGAVPDPSAPGYHRLAAEAELIESGLPRYQWHVAEQLARRLEGLEAELCEGRQALRTLESMSAVLDAAEGSRK